MTTTFTPPEFESTSVGRLKQEIWEAEPDEIDRILREEFVVPSLGEIETPGSYIQMTHSDVLADRRTRNDIVLIPLGSTEFHGRHSVSAQDTLQVTRLVEGVRRA